MSCLRESLYVAIVALLAATGRAQIAEIGDVTVSIDRIDNQQPVARANVRVVADENSTTNFILSDGSGIIHLAIPPYEPGSAYTFTVIKWIVVSPCDTEGGRTNLPRAGRRVSLRVLPVGDHRLLDSEEIGCLLLEYTAHFNSKSVPPDFNPASTLKPKNFVGPPRNFWDQSGSPIPKFGFYQSTDQDNTDFVSQPRIFSLTLKSKELGLSKSKLEKAIDKWRKSATNPYDKGLAAIYVGDYVTASRLFSESIELPEWKDSGNITHKLIGRARAEHERGNQGAAEADLRALLRIDNGNKIARRDLTIVRGKEKPDPKPIAAPVVLPPSNPPRNSIVSQETIPLTPTPARPDVKSERQVPETNETTRPAEGESESGKERVSKGKSRTTAKAADEAKQTVADRKKTAAKKKKRADEKQSNSK